MSRAAGTEWRTGVIIVSTKWVVLLALNGGAGVIDCHFYRHYCDE